MWRMAIHPKQETRDFPQHFSTGARLEIGGYRLVREGPWQSNADSSSPATTPVRLMHYRGNTQRVLSISFQLRALRQQFPAKKPQSASGPCDHRHVTTTPGSRKGHALVRTPPKLPGASPGVFVLFSNHSRY